MFDALYNILARMLPVLRGADAHRTLRNVAFNSADYLLVPLLWLICTPVFVHRLGTETYGIWMLTNGLLGLGGVVSLGLADATIKFVARRRAHGDAAGVVAVFRSTMTLYGVLGLAAGAVVFALAPFLAARVFKVSADLVPLTITGFRIAGVALVGRFAQGIFQSGIYGFERHDLAARVRMLTTTASMLTSVILVWLGFGFAAVLWTMTVFLFAGGIALAWVLKTRLAPELIFSPSFDRRAWREMIGFGMTSWVRDIISSLAYNMDSFLIGIFLGPAPVAYYGVGRRLAQQVHALLSNATAALFPLSGKLFDQNDLSRLRTLYDRAMLAILLCAVGLLLPLYVLGPSIMDLWMGPAFSSEASLVLRVLCIHYALLPMTIVNYHYMRGAGLVKMQTIIIAATSLITFAGLFFLIPRYGILGAAIAQLLGLPMLIFSRAYLEHRLFIHVDVKGMLSYFAPIAVPFVAATVWMTVAAVPHRSLPSLIMGWIVFSGVGTLASYGIARGCRRLGWMRA